MNKFCNTSLMRRYSENTVYDNITSMNLYCQMNKHINSEVHLKSTIFTFRFFLKNYFV